MPLLDPKIFDAIRLPARVNVAEWTEKHRRLAAATSARPGAWQHETAPYQRGVMLAASEAETRSIAMMAATQTMKTETIINVLFARATLDPCPMLLVMPTESGVEEFLRDRIWPAALATPAVQRVFPGPRSRAGLVDKTTIKFSGGGIYGGWPRSAATLAGRPIALLACDEIDKWPPSAGPADRPQGDPVELARLRLDTYGDAAMEILASSPTVPGSPIALEFERGDQRLYFIPCPHCESMAPLSFKQRSHTSEDPGGWHSLWWPAEGTRQERADGALLTCFDCGGQWGEPERHKQLLAGEWAACAVGEQGCVSFWLSALYAPWTPLAKLVTEWYRVREDDETDRLRAFVNSRLAEPYEDKPIAVDEEKVLERIVTTYSVDDLPSGALWVTCAVDVQQDRLEAYVAAWGDGEQHWGLELQVFAGDPNDIASKVWGELDQLLRKIWRTMDGRLLGVNVLGIDIGSDPSGAVQRWVAAKARAGQGNPKRFRSAIAVRGAGEYQGGARRTIAGAPWLTGRRSKSAKERKRQLERQQAIPPVTIYPVGTSAAKSLIANRLRLEFTGKAQMHWHAGFDKEWFSQLGAEREVESVAGTRRWIKTRPRNEALDLLVYSFALLFWSAPRTGLKDEIDWDRLVATARLSRKAAQGELPKLKNQSTMTASQSVTITRREDDGGAGIEINRTR